MQLKTILNKRYPLKSHVNESVREEIRQESPVLVVKIRPRKNGVKSCSNCGIQGCPGYDTLRQREVEFVSILGQKVFFEYTLRRVACPDCGPTVEALPWVSYQVRLITRNISCIARRLKSLLEGVSAAKLYYGHSQRLDIREESCLGAADDNAGFLVSSPELYRGRSYFWGELPPSLYRRGVCRQPYLEGPVFIPLRDPEYFKKVRIEGSSIAWPNGADFAPEFLFENGSEISLDEYEAIRLKA